MKKYILCAFFLTSFLNAQELEKKTDYTIYRNLLLERSTGASSEALGRMFFNFEPSAFSIKTNPAMAAEGWNADAGYSYSSPYYFSKDFEDSYYDYKGVRASLGNIGSFGFSRYYLKESSSYEDYNYPEGFNRIGIDADTYMYSFSYSREIIDGLYIGILANYFRENIYSAYFENATLGFGAVKIFSLPSICGISNTVGIGVTFENLIEIYEGHPTYSNTYVDLDPSVDPGSSISWEPDIIIPQRMDASLSYKGEYSLVSAKAQFEYRKVLNSEYYTEIAEALEVGVYNSLFLRIGNYAHTDFSDEFENTLTYGAGVKISGDLIGVKFPFAVTFDYADLPFKKYYENDEEERYSIYSIGLFYDFN
jgi:hypothetical protein